MIETLKNIPSHVAGFKLTGKVTGSDYEKVVIPVIEDKLNQTGEINFLLLIDTDLGDFTFGAWMQDALLGLKHITKWRKAAIVIDNQAVIAFTDGFSVLVPGEFKGFKKVDYEKALEWLEH